LQVAELPLLAAPFSVAGCSPLGYTGCSPKGSRLLPFWELWRVGGAPLWVAGMWAVSRKLIR